ncbi:MAG: DUF1893 domain-containing protein [Oscillospiraceae bacterium]|nr:DUF1893 domain-containing protein [Oscillospiraceae bacterium]
MKTDLSKAAEILKSGEYTCVLCKGEETVTYTERGVKPLLDLLDSEKGLNGFSPADKVVGKAAAFLYILLEVKTVYAPVMSLSAIHLFEANGVFFRYDVSVENIINRSGTGICPMEEAVKELSVPEEALKAIRKRLSELQSRSA